MKESQIIVYFLIVSIFGFFLWRYFKKESFSSYLNIDEEISTSSGSMSSGSMASGSMSPSCDINTIVDLSGTDDCCENCSNLCSGTSLSTCTSRCIKENHSDPNGCGNNTPSPSPSPSPSPMGGLGDNRLLTSTGNIINVPEVSETLLI